MLPPDPIVVQCSTPAFWNEKLVLLDHFDSEGLIREVPFHRGLNIVRTPATAPAQAGEQAAEIGNLQNPEPHSVGKTLLVRMIRYSMGEECIVTGEENEDLKRACPDGHLIALGWLEADPWPVIRPFHSTDPKDSSCVQAKDWKDVFEQSIEPLMHRDRARSAMASVIAFDLGAVLASMCGVGNHPRFLIHDSPREGEMIMTFFRRIFQAAIWMQSLTNSEPCFQYIVTTADALIEYSQFTTKPTCIVLSGDDRLLKRNY